MIFHALSILIVKIFTSEEFKQDQNSYNKFLHVVENINCSLPYRDWDEDKGKSKNKEEFAKRSQNTEYEIILSQLEVKISSPLTTQGGQPCKQQNSAQGGPPCAS